MEFLLFSTSPLSVDLAAVALRTVWREVTQKDDEPLQREESLDFGLFYSEYAFAYSRRALRPKDLKALCLRFEDPAWSSSFLRPFPLARLGVQVADDFSF